MTGTRLDAVATIVFDTEAPLDTPAIFNTIDAGTPASSVGALPERTRFESFTLSWTGQDDTGGSGIASFDIFVAEDDGPFTLLLDDTADTSTIFTGRDGHRYAFFSVATDNVGLVQPTPVAGQAFTTVLLNRAPDAQDDAASTPKNTPVTIAVKGNDSDADDDALTVTAVTQAALGTAEINADGSITFTPAAGFVGTDVFTYTVGDGFGGTDTANVTITAFNRPPSAAITDAPASSPEGTAITLGSSVSDPDPGDSVSLAWTVTTIGVAFTTGAGPSFTFTPDDNGTYVVTLTATDDDGGVGTDSVSITVTNIEPTVDAGPDHEIPAGATFSATGSFSDPGADTWSASVDYGDGSGDQPLALAADRTFILELAYTNPGTYTATVTVADDDSGVGFDTFAATVVPVDRPIQLSGRVFNDLNNDGVVQSAETGIADVTIQLFRESDLSTPLATQTTDDTGAYFFNLVLEPGLYRLVEVQPAGYLDGKEQAGTLGGSVDNTRDSNTIAGISVISGGVTEALDYLFAELAPSRLQGLVWEDFNNDGDIGFGEKAIAGVPIPLVGSDDRGSAVSRSAVTDSQGIFELLDPRPGSYTLIETQPQGFDDGIDALGTVNGVVTGDASVNDRFGDIVLPRPGADGENYNFGERPPAGGSVQAGQTATIGFWQNKHGQGLIRSLNGGPSATQLGDWLAATFPNLYGELAGKSNDYVASYYTTLFRRTARSAPAGPPKLDAQVLAVALALYVTNATLAGSTASAYGFQVTQTGLATATINVGTRAAAFGLDDGSTATVLDLVLAADARSPAGLMYDEDGSGTIDSSERTLRELANELFTFINELGDI